MKKSLLSIFVMASALLMASCSNEEPAAVVNADPESADVELSENALVLSHEDGLESQDVKIVSVDSATMTVSNKYLEEKDMTLKAGNAICVWRAVDEVPFVRVIDAVSDNGATTTITSHAGNVADVIRDGELNLSCEAFVNPNVKGDARYRSDDNVYHPAVVIMENDDDIDYATGEELVARAFEVDRTFTLYDKTISINKRYATSGDELAFSINSGYVHPSFQLDFYLNISSLKVQQFHTYAVGAIDVSLPMKVQANVAKSGTLDRNLYTKSFTIDRSMFNSPKLNYIFKIGVVPVTITVDASIDLSASFDAMANLEATLPFRYNGKLTIGPKYDISDGWSLYKDFQQTRSSVLKEMEIDGEASITAEAAIYASLHAKVYGSAGPTVKVGPHIKAGAAVSGSYADGFTAQSKGVFMIDGELSAGIDILGYKLANWSKAFELYKVNLWNWNKTLEFGHNNL